MNTIFSSPIRRILVVDDSATSRAIIEKQLKKLGCTVAVAQNGASGLDAMTKQDYDLVLLDCQMPDMSGYEVVAHYRARERDNGGGRARLPVIAISAEDGATHQQLCVDCGMDDVLSKPLSFEALTTMLSSWCDTRTLSSPTTWKEMHSTELTGLFRSTSFEDFNTMQTLASQANLQMVSRLAHRMKGAALTMAAESMVATLERIEALAADHLDPFTGLAREFEILRKQLQLI